jgi:2-polyprenyl-6-hydroxyphenyl methylase/3-demethylubiquinone-9 3-methyltransferase
MTPAPAQAIRSIVGSYDDLVIRLYSRVRFTILRQIFLEEIGQYLPKNGRILDLGCGFGLFSLYFATLGPERRITGVDQDARRIELARASAARLNLTNVDYHVGDGLDWNSDESFDAIYLLDLIHHLPRASVPEFLERLRGRLRPGGVLVLKDIEDRPWWKVMFTLALDRLMVGTEPIHYWSPAELQPLLEGLGFDVVRHRMRDFLPYPHIVYVNRLPRG